MNDNADLSKQTTTNRLKTWSRLLGMALLLALGLHFFPFPTNGTAHLPLRPDGLFEGGGTPGLDHGLAVSLPFGPALVQATGGLTITKSVSPLVVEHGGVLTYTLTITNDTGGIIRNVQVTDTVPASTTCESLVIPSTWVGSQSTCQDTGLAAWYLLPIFDRQMAPGQRQTFTYTVRLDKPLADGAQIVNAAGSYSVKAENGAFTDLGTTSVTAQVLAPVWAIDKTAEPSPFVTPGELLTYTLTVTNVGSWPTDAPYVVTDTLPAYTAFEDGTPPPTGPGNGIITWTVTSALDPLESADLVYAVRLDTPLTDGLKIVNQRYGVQDGNVLTPAAGQPVTITVSSGPNLGINKAADRDPVPAGSLLTYTITYSNSGTDSATGVVISDTIPPQTEFVNAIPGYDTTNGDEYHWAIGDLSPLAGEQVIILTVRVTDTIADQTPITNVVAIGADIGNTATDTEVVTVASKPVLKVSKRDSADPAPITDPLVYTILITNSGTSTATNVILTDNLADGTTFVRSDPATSTQSPPDSYGFLLPPIPPDAIEQVIITTTIEPTVSDQDVLLNQITVTSAETTTVAISEQTTVAAPKLLIDKSVVVPEPPATARAGETITYTISYTNDGSLPAYGILITDSLPVSLTNVISAPGSAALVDGTPPDLVFSLATLGVGASEQIIIQADLITTPWAVEPLAMVNTVTATHDLGAPPTGHTVSTNGLPGLAEAATLVASPQQAVINTPVLVTATLVDAFDNLVLDGTTVVFSSTLAQSTTSPANTTNGQAVSTLTSPAPGQTFVSVETPDGVTQTPVSVTFVAADLALTKTVNLTDASPLQTLIYTLTVRNSGSHTATTLITDTLPSGVTYAGANPSPILMLDPTYVFSLGQIPGNETRTVIITATVDGDVPDGSELTNQAVAGAPEAIQPFPSDSVFTTIGAPNFAISKAAFPARTVAGETVTYTITFTNDGSLAVTGLRITDTLPAQVAAANATFDGGLLTQESSTLPDFVFSAGSPFSGAGAITITAQLATTPWPSIPVPLTNQVTATYDINPNPFIAQTDVTGSSGPPFALVLTATPSITRINNFIDLTARITDRYGNPITDGQTIVFDSPLGTDSPTSSNGQANSGLSSSVGGAFPVTARVEGTTISDTTVVTFTAPAVAISKTSDRPEAPPGGTIVYTIIVSNTGDSTLDPVVVQDFLQDGLNYVSANPTPDAVVGQQLTFDLGALGTGISQTITLTATLSLDVVEGLFLQNAAQVETAQTDPVQAFADIQVAAAALTIDKQVEPAVVLAGDPLTYTITYANNDDELITDIRLIDHLPTGLTDVSVDPGGATVALNSGGTIILTRSELALSESDQIIITARAVTSPWPAAGRTITNVVTATTATQTGQRLAAVSSQGRPNQPASLIVEADPISTTVGSSVVVTATVWDQYGNPAYDGTEIVFGTSLAGTSIGSPVSTVDGVAVATLTSTVVGTTTVQAQVAGLGESIAVRFSERPVYGLYLPVVYRDYAEPPRFQADLMVEAISVTPADPATGQPVNIEVTIRNTGVDPASRFWVDLYLTNNPVTPDVNQLWSQVGDLGVAWIVPGLNAGQSITLSNLNPNAYSDPTDCQNYSNFTPEQVGSCIWAGNSNRFTVPGTYYVTAQVDSFAEDSSLADGNIAETDETNNLLTNPVALQVGGSALKQPTPVDRPAFEFAVPGNPRPPLQFK